MSSQPRVRSMQKASERMGGRKKERKKKATTVDGVSTICMIWSLKQGVPVICLGLDRLRDQFYLLVVFLHFKNIHPSFANKEFVKA